ncbi:MAG TPA: thiamine pyrophosphate-dependent dehydrogenase E1 component subunit alpha [Blastocatellia bacterium]|jgi:TPP-dependent pyruvate/acetoin dehydrogenase alpha subunit|nr:thiamine pyrophosphate-dependent dehydrogenase E1 component subunit alpha [Blastocatellia bacterium]
MNRYPSFDPPEYVNWHPDPEVVAEYQRTIDGQPERREIIRALTPPQLIALYEGLVRNRLHDIALQRWVKQGVISKAWLGTGEEATTIGAVHALERRTAPGGFSTDFVAPMIRNAGAYHEMGMPVADMLRGYLGTADSPTHGRDLHIGDFKRGVLAAISHVGDLMAATVGVALSFKMRREPRVALTWIGDGSTKNGVFHEAMNFAAVQRLPLIVIIQNNQVALGTRLDQHHNSSFSNWPEAYGVEGWAYDGNNVLDAYAAVKLAADLCRADASSDHLSRRGPFLLVAETFRMGGHATHDEREARETFDGKLFAYWGKRDPIGQFENHLIEGTLDLESGRRIRRSQSMQDRNRSILKQAEERVTAEVELAIEEALASRVLMPSPESAAEGVYAEKNVSRFAFRV